MSVLDKIRRFMKTFWNRLGHKTVVKVIHLEYIFVALLCVLCLGKFVIFGSHSSKPTKTVEFSSVAETLPPAKATLCTAGDLMLHSPFLSTEGPYYNAESNLYDFADIFKYIKADYNAANYTVATFEGSLTGEPYMGYPMFHTPETFMKNMKDSGIDLCLLGNNHIYDGLGDGLKSTMEKMEAIQFDYLGIRKTTTTKKYRVQDVNGIKIGIVDYVYETNSETGAKKAINGIDVADEDADLINSFSENKLSEFYTNIESDYNAMKSEGAEFCIAYMHWGYEYQTTEDAYQDEMAQKMCDIGFNAIIGSHPHVIQPVDVLESTDKSHKSIVCYAIGNHLSNQRKEILDEMPTGETEDGVTVTLTIERDDNGDISITDAAFLPTWVYRYYDGISCTYYILPCDEPDKLPELTGITDLGTQPKDSAERTNAIIGEGVNKVKTSLPIK